MKKSNVCIVCLILLSASLLLFCNNPTEPTPKNELVGKWIVRDHFNDTIYQREFEFTDDYRFHNIYSLYVKNVLDLQKFLNGTYSVKNTKLTCTFTDKTEEQFYYEIKFGLLRMYTIDYSDTIILAPKN